MTEQAQFVHGLVQYPLATSTGASALHDADPSLYYCLDYFSSVLTTYMQARLVAEAGSAGLSTGPNAVASAVKYMLPYDPKRVVAEQMVGKWPLLAIWRQSSKYRWRTVARMETQAVFQVAYVLPPMTGGQMERMIPFLNSVPKILLNRIENKFDPAYKSGANFMALAGLDEIDLTEDAWGSYELPQSNLEFPAWLGKLLVVERDEDMPLTAAGGPFSGLDVTMDLVTVDSGVLPAALALEVDYPLFTGQLGASSLPLELGAA